MTSELLIFSVRREFLEWSLRTCCVAHLPRKYIQCYTKDDVAPLLPGPRLIELNSFDKRTVIAPPLPGLNSMQFGLSN